MMGQQRTKDGDEAASVHEPDDGQLGTNDDNVAGSNPNEPGGLRGSTLAGRQQRPVPRVYSSRDLHGGLTIPGPYNPSFALQGHDNGNDAVLSFSSQRGIFPRSSNSDAKSMTSSEHSPSKSQDVPTTGSNMVDQGSTRPPGNENASQVAYNTGFVPRISSRRSGSLATSSSTPLAIPITLNDQPPGVFHQHQMGYTKCKHLSNSYVECEEASGGGGCTFNRGMKLHGRCEECTQRLGFKNSVRRLGSWVSRTANRIGSGGQRTSIDGAFDGSGVQNDATGATDPGNLGDGDRRGRITPSQPTEHFTRSNGRHRRFNIRRGQTGSSVGAGGFDPTTQEDTESDKT